MGHFAGTHRNFLVRSAMSIPFNPPRHHFTVAMVAFREINQGRNQQLLALHQT
jgi:hypothetical protein